MNKKLLEDLFQAYFDARKNKRRTFSALKFEDKFEENIFKLYEDIVAGKYQPGRSICFIVNHPIKREIFAADFRDRIVHHLIYNYINPIFERHFIFDCYSCRIGKGVQCGVKRTDHFIRSCSQNYKQDCYVLKLDISGYFMSMDKDILYKQVKKRLMTYEKENKINFNLELILSLIQKTIFCDPTKNCKIKGKASDWDTLPKSKSLFYCKENKGLPIGNLTSQLFGNVYLNDLDYFVKYGLKCKYYGRYVDDFIIIHESREFLKKVIVKIKKYLTEKLLLKLHPNKIYLQHFSRGVSFLGVYFKPFRLYIKNKNKGNARKKIAEWNKYLLKNNNILNR
jgi:RNA-directed DNA polymerase